MTYIKWKDEVESYLGNLSESEKQKVFSYFAEMYADKRDAGISEERIIEGFGAPYDVAQRIIADSKEPSAQNENASSNAGGTVNGSGGNNYNYNYYNYNYGGAPAGFNAGANPPDNASYYGRDYAKPDPADVDVSDIDMPLPEGTPKVKEKNKKGNPVVSVLLLILLAIPVFALFCTGIGLIVGFFSAAIGCIVSGCATVGEAVGGLVCGLGKSQIGLMGSGFIQFGVGALFVPLTILVAKLVWKLMKWVFRHLKTIVTA